MQRDLVQREEESPIIFLCDNGSLAPLAIQALRLTAAALSHNTTRVVFPVGLLHSDRVLEGDSGTVLLTSSATTFFVTVGVGELTHLWWLPLGLGLLVKVGRCDTRR